MTIVNRYHTAANIISIHNVFVDRDFVLESLQIV